jgi:2-polyprenyl-6-methoxyphenol hydroxylase and related FAD-dependent oxidoreductases
MAKDRFRVIIVGGGVAGLTLANALEVSLFATFLWDQKGHALTVFSKLVWIIYSSKHEILWHRTLGPQSASILMEPG